MLASVGRAERRHHGALYVQGLLLDGDRKSIEPLARRVPGADVQALQQFVGQSPCAWEPVRRRLAQRMAAALKPAAAWVIDDTGFPKQGRHSVGVAPQYSGTLGKVGNCQVAVTVKLSTETESMPLNWALYLPQAWVADTERCRRAGVEAVWHQAGVGFGAERSAAGLGPAPAAGAGRCWLWQQHELSRRIGPAGIAIRGRGGIEYGGVGDADRTGASASVPRPAAPA